jgi:PAS domain S-box-containing protein
MKTVFLINDQVNELRFLTELLRGEPYAVKKFESAEAALAALDPACPPELIITDLCMPGVDGWQLCRLLRSSEYEAFIRIPILVVSATFAGSEIERTSRELGADAFFHMPVEKDQLLPLVRDLVQGKAQPDVIRVLVAESRRCQANAIKSTLDASSYAVELFQTAEEALVRLASVSFDMAAIDHHLSVGTGGFFLERLRAENPSCVVLVTIPENRPDLALEATQAGADAWLQKPLDYDSLIEVFTRVRRERALLGAQALLEAGDRRSKRREAFYQALLCGIEDPVLIQKISADGTPGPLVEVNSAACELLGYGREEFLRRNPFELLPPEAFKAFSQASDTINAHGRVIFETTQFSRDGRRLPVDNHLSVFEHEGERYVVCVCRDISARRSPGQTLRKRLRYEQKLAEASACLLRKGTPRNNITDALSRLCEGAKVGRVYIFANVSDPVEGLCMRQEYEACASGVSSQIGNALLWHLPYQNGFERWRAALSAGEAIQGIVAKFPEPERAVLEPQGILSILVLPLFVGGSWWGFIGFDDTRALRQWQEEDIRLLRVASELIGGYLLRAETEAERLSLEKRAARIEKAESLSRMAGAVAHHFNNMLGAAMGNLEMLLADVPHNSPLRARMEAAMQASSRASEVSAMMLTYLGQAPGQQIPLGLAALVRRCRSALRQALSGEGTLEIELPDEDPVAEVVPDQIQQLLVRLVENAGESYSTGRPMVRLSVRMLPAEVIPDSQRFPVDWRPVEPFYVCLEVADAGCGIGAGDMNRLFDPFFSRKFTGRGMGLAAVLGIVTRHGGGITVSSVPHRGSTFRVFLPASKSQLPVEEDAVVASAAFEKIGKVLLVEDEEVVRSMAQAMLERLGYSVIATENGKEAVACFLNHPGDIWCVVCDLTMPGMDGWETLKALRKLEPDLPVILASGYDESRAMAGCCAEPPSAFLAKPYGLEDLRALLGKVLGQV